MAVFITFIQYSYIPDLPGSKEKTPKPTSCVSEYHIFANSAHSWIRHDPDVTHFNYGLLKFHMCSSVYIDTTGSVDPAPFFSLLGPP